MSIGKTNKSVFSMMHEFRVFGGLNIDNMIELVHGNLKSEEEAETFAFRTTVSDGIVSCLMPSHFSAYFIYLLFKNVSLF